VRHFTTRPAWYKEAVFALTGGEIALIAFLFALVWGAGLLPRLGERLGERFAKRGRHPANGE
jgi:hypothetical protein